MPRVTPAAFAAAPTRPSPATASLVHRVARRIAGSLVCCLGGAGGCTGDTISLGNAAPPPYHFGAPVLVTELSSTVRSDNPTLTGDLLEIYFTTARESGNNDVWFATRATASGPFGAPGPVPGVNGASFETSSAISTDGLTLWFGSDRPGGSGNVDVWVSQRAARTAAWSAPVNVPALSSPADDIPRPPGLHSLVMPVASTRLTSGNPVAGDYQTYLAARATPGSPFGAPAAIPELDYPDRSTVDGFLTDDGLTLFFSSARAPASILADGGDAGAPTSDLFVAFRLSPAEPFSVTQALDDLNTPGDERDPWLSPDGRTLYFTSDRSGVLTIYTAQVDPR